MDDDLDRQVERIAREIIASDPLLVAIGRALAPTVNERLDTFRKQKGLPAAPKTYCAGCGDPWPDPDNLCDGCMVIENAANGPDPSK